MELWNEARGLWPTRKGYTFERIGGEAHDS